MAEEIINITIDEIVEDVNIVVNETTEDVNITIQEISKTSDLINDGEDGLHPFITSENIPLPSDATSTSKGILKLTNDLGGTADAPTVPGLANKVDKVTGKGLSTNDYTTAEQTKLAGIQTGATANSSDATLLNRANHTGTQLAATISDFASSVASLITNKVDKVTGYSLTKNDLTDALKLIYDNSVSSLNSLLSTGARLITNAEITKLSNTSGSNTGDENTATIKSKLGLATTSTDGYLTSTDWTTFNNKQNALGFTPYRFSNASWSTVTGTTSKTVVATTTIAANTFNSTDIMKLAFRVSKTVAASSTTIRIEINTINQITGSTVIAAYGMAAGVTFANLQRTISINGNTTAGVSASITNIINDFAISSTASFLTTISSYNVANPLFVFFTVQNGATGDSTTFDFANITN